MRETWYVLESGDVADPANVVADENGKLFSVDGVAVAMRGDVHSSRGVDADEERAKVGNSKKDHGKSTGKDMNPEASKRTYKTRDVAGE